MVKALDKHGHLAISAATPGRRCGLKYGSHRDGQMEGLCNRGGMQQRGYAIHAAGKRRHQYESFLHLRPRLFGEDDPHIKAQPGGHPNSVEARPHSHAAGLLSCTFIAPCVHAHRATGQYVRTSSAIRIHEWDSQRILTGVWKQDYACVPGR
eukprot:42044-Chlamydomonas_euryale.AAC.1